MEIIVLRLESCSKIVFSQQDILISYVISFVFHFLETNVKRKGEIMIIIFVVQLLVALLLVVEDVIVSLLLCFVVGCCFVIH